MSKKIDNTKELIVIRNMDTGEWCYSAKYWPEWVNDLQSACSFASEKNAEKAIKSWKNVQKNKLKNATKTLDWYASKGTYGEQYINKLKQQVKDIEENPMIPPNAEVVVLVVTYPEHLKVTS